MNLVPKYEFMNKCIQLYETIMVRHGLMVVGAAYSGKSKVIEVLRRSFSHINNEEFAVTRAWYINPKSIEMTQLYGLFDEDSGEWTDGVLAIRIGACARDESEDRKWIVFDGPVDAKWIENMNTVLDDNKKLCLSSGAIIKLKPSMTIMFEVDDLSYASPATVSRCGMVLLEPHELGHNVLIQSYVVNMKKIVDDGICDKIEKIMHYVCDTTCDFVYK
jgi:dynein heavy chain